VRSRPARSQYGAFAPGAFAAWQRLRAGLLFGVRRFATPGGDEERIEKQYNTVSNISLHNM